MEESFPSGDTSSSSWLTAIKWKLYEMFRKSYSYLPLRYLTQWLTESFGITISMSQFPWKSLPAILAKHGFILRGYPDILLPGEVRGNNKTKGIGDLFSTEQVDLATSLELMGRTDYPLHLTCALNDPLDGM